MLYEAEVRGQVALESVEQDRLVRVNDAPRPGNFYELGLVDLPGRATRRGAIGSAAGERVDPLPRARVIDVAELDERALDEQAGLLERLAPRGRFERLVGIGRTLGDAPWGAPVVVACGV